MHNRHLSTGFTGWSIWIQWLCFWGSPTFSSQWPKTCVFSSLSPQFSWPSSPYTWCATSSPSTPKKVMFLCTTTSHWNGFSFVVDRLKIFVEWTGSSLLTTFGVFLNSLKMCCLHYRHLSGDVANWLDRAKENNGGCYSETSVENVKILVKLFPLFGLQLLYRACITQASTRDKSHLVRFSCLFFSVKWVIISADPIRLLSTDDAFKLETRWLYSAGSGDEGDQHTACVDRSTSAGASEHLLPVSKKETSISSHVYQ